MVKACFVSLVLVVSALAGQSKTPSRPPLKFTLVLPKGVASEQVQAFEIYGSDPDFHDFFRPQPALTQYDLKTPSTGAKLILYMPGCEIQLLDLKPNTPKSRTLECRRLPLVSLTGQVPRDLSAGKSAEIEVRYEATWSHEYFGIQDGMIATFRVATAIPDENGVFTVALPDFSLDPHTTQWKLPSAWSFMLREVRSGNILARLKPSVAVTAGDDLEVRSSYPDMVTFSAGN